MAGLGGKPSGIVSVNYNPDGSFLLSLDAADLPSSYGIDEGVAFISSGTSCNLDDLAPTSGGSVAVVNTSALVISTAVLLVCISARPG